MADTNVAIKLFKESATDKHVGINVANNAVIDDLRNSKLFVNGSIGTNSAIKIMPKNTDSTGVFWYYTSNSGNNDYNASFWLARNATYGFSTRFRFLIYSYDSTSYTRNNFYECYSLPSVQAGLTENKTYNIITTKNISDIGTIPITQGGTGATTAADARTNLGAAAASHTHSYAGSSSAGGAANSAIKLDHITLNSTTINNTAGSFAFSGSGDPWSGTDWVGLQIGDNVDKFQISANGNTIVFRENDNGGTNTSWSNWVTMLTSANYTSYAASASHNHAAGDITSGTLAVARGGTGGGTAAAARGNLGAMGAISANGYYGMTRPNGTDTDWIRTTTLGLIPYQSGGSGSGHCGLGTSSWYFSYAYIDSIYTTSGAAGFKCRNISYGSGDPSGGSSGDIYIKFV